VACKRLRRPLCSFGVTWDEATRDTDVADSGMQEQSTTWAKMVTFWETMTSWWATRLSVCQRRSFQLVNTRAW
jgi:hypothetical protein